MRGKNKSGFLYSNGLSLVLLACVFISLAGQFITGFKEHNQERLKDGLNALSASDYFFSGHFIQATFENWESEFLQMAMYVMFTIWLRQKGSAESKSLKGHDPVDREPSVHPHAPWPVRKGGVWLKLYNNSLSLAFALLFLLSFFLHLYGSLKDYNEEQELHGQAPLTAWNYLSEPRFWFESFQNWQSEFLAVLSIVLLSIWFRQKGSPESKPVDAPHDQTGE